MTQIFAFAPFNSRYVKQVSPEDPPSSHLSHNPKLWPFFRRALGAIDGSHIHATTRADHRETCRNRKGFISQNCLFCCSFDLLFSYVLTGWEGSASDARVYESAISDDLIVPDGWYLLADAGFPHCKELLVPYRGVRYHLAEWGRANLRYVDPTLCHRIGINLQMYSPQDKEELFNLRHAQARNVIERIFGVLKKRFRILLIGPEYDMTVQAQIPAALCALHNFIRIHDPHEQDLPDEEYYDQGGYAGDGFVRQVRNVEDNNPRGAVARRRDLIAEAMWNSYQAVLEERSTHDMDDYLYNTDE
jgi:hypothetical protein